MTSQALEAADKAVVGIFAFRDGRGRPMAWPVTPYVDGENVVVTSTLAYIRKADHVRRDGRVALLCGALHMTGQASVRADVSGEEFVARFLDQELRKYPPARQIMRMPLHRILFSWYFGRVLMQFVPLEARKLPGQDRCTLVTLDEGGFPTITPIAEPNADDSAFALSLYPSGGTTSLPGGQATVLLHAEPTMSDLRQLVLRGHIEGGMFHVRSRIGTLGPAPRAGWLRQLRGQLDMHWRGRRSRKIIAGWEV